MICRASQLGCREALWHKYGGAGGELPSIVLACGWLELVPYAVFKRPGLIDD